MFINPKALPDQGTIGIIAPSSRADMDKLEGGISALESHGYNVKLHEQIHKEDRQSAGSAQDRANAIMDVFKDPEVDAIIVTVGGNRSMHTLPLLDYDVIKNNPKPFLGFSDSTALVNGFYAKTGLVTYHGPSLSRIGRNGEAEQDQMISVLKGYGQTLDFSTATSLRGGQATGRLVGGNLSMMAALMGTPYMPPVDGAILFLEEINDQLSRYDRMLTQLALAGVFDKVSAVIFGVMKPEGDSAVTPFGFELHDIIQEHLADRGIPVMMDAPFGHVGPLWTLPVGGMASLDADTGTLTLEKTGQAL